MSLDRKTLHDTQSSYDIQRKEGFSVSLDRETLHDTQSSYDIQPALSDLNILSLGNKSYTRPSTLPLQNVYAPQKRQNVLT